MGVKSAIKAALWSTRMAAFEASGQGRRRWCATQGLNVNTFNYWRCRLRDLSAATMPASPLLSRPRNAPNKRPPITAPDLVPVLVRSTSAFARVSASTLVELEWPNGVRLRTTLSVPELGTMVRALMSC